MGFCIPWFLCVCTCKGNLSGCICQQLLTEAFSARTVFFCTNGPAKMPLTGLHIYLHLLLEKHVSR